MAIFDFLIGGLAPETPVTLSWSRWLLRLEGQAVAPGWAWTEVVTFTVGAWAQAGSAAAGGAREGTVTRHGGPYGGRAGQGEGQGVQAAAGREPVSFWKGGGARPSGWVAREARAQPFGLGLA